MSWIKPNFLWMMYRSGWGTKPNQEAVLGIRLKREFFDRLLEKAVVTSFEHSDYKTHEEWRSALNASDVRLQWDPDHDPYGEKISRRAIQLGIKGDTLKEFGMQEIINVIDMSQFISAQRKILREENLSELITPTEMVYSPSNTEIGRHLKLD